MVWIKDIWVYFLNEADIEKGYIEYGTDNILFEQNESCIEIPRMFTRVGLLREFILNSNDKKLIRLSQTLSDPQLCDIYHRNYSFNYQPDNIYSQWVPYAKNRIFDYAEEWCFANNIKCSRKESEPLGKFVYLDCL